MSDLLVLMATIAIVFIWLIWKWSQQLDYIAKLSEHIDGLEDEWDPSEKGI